MNPLKLRIVFRKINKKKRHSKKRNLRTKSMFQMTFTRNYKFKRKKFKCVRNNLKFQILT